MYELRPDEVDKHMVEVLLHRLEEARQHSKRWDQRLRVGTLPAADMPPGHTEGRMPS